MTYTIDHYINGQSATNHSGNYQDIFNPATGDIIGKVALGDEHDVNKAVTAAQAALPSWSQTTPISRARILFNYKHLLDENLEQLAALITQEHGKTIADAKGSVMRGIEVVEFATSVPDQLKGEFSAEVGTGVDSYSMRQPLGVCAGITPFNFPAMIPLWMFPMCIACGNTFVLKPSEKDPSVGMRLVELLHLAGVPTGVVNIVNGDKVAVDALLNHPDIAAVSSVGSTPVAEHIYKTATQNNKRVQALGGAKNHCIVMPDADIDEATNAILGAAYGSAGERCMAISVVVAVGDETADKLISGLTPKVQDLKIGPGTNDDVEMGPLITADHLHRVTSYIQTGTDEGAKLVVDGREVDVPNQGFYLGGSLFDQVTPEMKIYQDEIFGPVLSIVRAPDFASAIKLINENAYGNGTAIFTRDGETARRFSVEINVGMVGINVPIPVPVGYHSFGGWKRSLFGDIHMYGREGIHFYTKLKTITSRWPKHKDDAEFKMPTHK